MLLNDPAIRHLIRPGMGFDLVDKSRFDFDYWNGRLIIYALPEKGATYALGCDVAEGLGKDRSVVEVLRIGDRKRPDEQVAEYACDYIDMMEFSPIINTIGRFYCDDENFEAIANIEVNGPGDSTIMDLNLRLNYGNFFMWKIYDRITKLTTNRIGFVTHKNTRPKLVGRGMHALKRGDLIVHSEFLLDEMADFQRDHHVARAAAVAGMHDDRVMALLLAYWAAHDDELIAGEDIAEERRVLAKAQEKWHTAEGTDEQDDAGQIADSQSPAVKPDWFNLPVSTEAMKVGWDNFFDE